MVLESSIPGFPSSPTEPIGTFPGEKMADRKSQGAVLKRIGSLMKSKALAPKGKIKGKKRFFGKGKHLEADNKVRMSHRQQWM